MRRFRYIWLIIPILVYSGVRLALGGQMLEANYGYSLLAPPAEYLRRLYDPAAALYTIVRIGLGLGALWWGLWGLRCNPALWRAGVVWCALVVLAAVLFSSHIIRVIGIVYPVVITGVLHSIERSRHLDMMTIPNVTAGHTSSPDANQFLQPRRH